jgi:hypothetical protein
MPHQMPELQHCQPTEILGRQRIGRATIGWQPWTGGLGVQGSTGGRPQPQPPTVASQASSANTAKQGLFMEGVESKGDIVSLWKATAQGEGWHRSAAGLSRQTAGRAQHHIGDNAGVRERLLLGRQTERGIPSITASLLIRTALVA